MQVIQQLNENFITLFVKDKLSAFIGDIFRNMDFVEREVFEEHDLIFDNLLSFCSSNAGQLQQNMKASIEFTDFNK